MSEAAPRTFRLVLEYAGGDFEGWQIQTGDRPARTVQGELAKAVESITGAPGRIRGAGRTDAGVHAHGQVASLRLGVDFAPEKLGRALNARLPDDVAVLACDVVGEDWDALREARGKHYRYQIWNGASRSPLRAERFAWIHEPLDPGRMRAAAETFVGRHDFASMCAAGSDVKTTVRTVLGLEVSGASRAEILIDVDGEGFLRHMVRNLAGTLIEIGRGRWEPSEAAVILASKDRGRAGPTAPARGLSLVQVRDTFSDPERYPRGESTSGRGGSIDLEGPVG
ncbi:MAG: tRNA pseudouridine(38-40) synthase TruA [Myxococcota bacterium]